MKEYTIGDVSWLVCQALDDTGRTTEDNCTECDADIPGGDESALCLDTNEVICLDCFRKELAQSGQSMRRNPIAMTLCECGDYADCGCGSCREHCVCDYQENPDDPYGPVDITLTRHEYFMLHRLDTSRSFVQQHLRGELGKQEQEDYAMDYHRLQNRRLVVGFDYADPWASSFGLQLTVDGRKALAAYRAAILPVKPGRPMRKGLRGGGGKKPGRQQINPCEDKSACDIYFAPDRNPSLRVGSTPAASIWRCPSCRKVNAWNWDDAENASRRLGEEVKVSHGSSFDNICGHCGTDFVKRNSPIRASVYTHEPRYRRRNPGFYF